MFTIFYAFFKKFNWVSITDVLFVNFLKKKISEQVFRNGNEMKKVKIIW